jgi:predicted DNA-binding ribbon-helix-helix protein
MALRKRSLLLDGHATSLTLEPAFWAGLEALAARRGLSLNAMVAAIDRERTEAASPGNLASAVRVAVLEATRRGEI